MSNTVMKDLHIELDQVSLDIGGKRILADVNLSFTPRRTTVLLGISGSGKSMLLKVAAGLLPPTSGEVRVNGVNMTALSESQEKEFRRNSGFVFQDGALWANRSILQNVQFPLDVHFTSMPEAERIRHAEEELSRVGYADNIHYRPSQISTGEQKMVSLARSLVTKPELLFLDNPLVSLDSGSAESMMDLIKRLHSDETTLIGSFGSAELISLIADELVVLNRGEVLISGEFREVRQTDDPAVRGIISSLFNEAASFDEDILEIINDEGIFS